MFSWYERDRACVKPIESVVLESFPIIFLISFSFLMNLHSKGSSFFVGKFLLFRKCLEKTILEFLIIIFLGLLLNVFRIPKLHGSVVTALLSIFLEMYFYLLSILFLIPSSLVKIFCAKGTAFLWSSLVISFRKEGKIF